MAGAWPEHGQDPPLKTQQKWPEWPVQRYKKGAHRGSNHGTICTRGRPLPLRQKQLVELQWHAEQLSFSFTLFLVSSMESRAQRCTSDGRWSKSGDARLFCQSVKLLAATSRRPYHAH